MRNSASERSTHGIPISMMVYATIQPHRPRIGRTSTRVSAIGTSSTRPEREPDEHEVDRPEALERDLDEQVRDTPDHAHRHEEHQAASAHGEIFYAVRLHMTQPRPTRAPSPLLLAISSLFVATLVASNILAVKIAAVGPFSVPAAIVIFPLAYLFGDVLTEVWGYRVARTVIWTGFFANIVVVLFIAAAIAIPADPHYTRPGRVRARAR